MLLPLTREAGQLSFHAWAFAPDQRVTLVVDGHTIGSQLLSESPTWLAFDFAADLARPLLSDVRLRFSTLVPVTEWALRLNRSGPSSLLVRSAGQETGDFGHIYLDGVERSPNLRGYNLVALHPDGRFLAAANFDTHLDGRASAALVSWVRALARRRAGCRRGAR